MMAGLENTGGTGRQSRVAERNRAQPVFCLIAWPRRPQPHRRGNGTSERIDCGKHAAATSHGQRRKHGCSYERHARHATRRFARGQKFGCLAILG
jgi:hypothetical protein